MMKFVFWLMSCGYFICALFESDPLFLMGFLILTWISLGIGCIVFKIEELK